MRSPKLARDRSKDWYRYYAGYAPEFVEDALRTLGVGDDDHILDPWNGSGTTTAVAQAQQLQATGFDANPALVLIARARLLGPEVAGSIVPLFDDLMQHADEFDLEESVGSDALDTWFCASAVRHIRCFERAIRHVLVDDSEESLTTPERVNEVSALAAFFYVALFHVVRTYVRPFVSSNPTWVTAATDQNRLSLIPDALHNSLRAVVEKLSADISERPAERGLSAVLVGDSTELKLPDNAATAVVTSPPYCTRIDYVAATRPELAVLGLSKDGVRRLRDDMVGTPTILSHEPEVRDTWGPSATSLVDAVMTHESRASATYYRKYFTQYLARLFDSLQEVRRVVTPGGGAVIVVQDSFYKDVHVDLPQIVSEMCEASGWHLAHAYHFDINRTKAAIHPTSKSWRTTFGATETVLVFE